MVKSKIEEHIQQWLSGDELVFKHILAHFYPRLLVFALKVVNNREDAEELVMNALLKIWQHKDRMGDVRHFDDYLFGMLRQEMARLFRKQVVPTETIDTYSLPELGSVDHPEFTIQELEAKYLSALQKLTPKQRAVFLAIREHDLTRKEVAQTTGMSLNTVNSHMNAAMQILRKEIQECPDMLIYLLMVGVMAGGIS